MVTGGPWCFDVARLGARSTGNLTKVNKQVHGASSVPTCIGAEPGCNSLNLPVAYILLLFVTSAPSNFATAGHALSGCKQHESCFDSLHLLTAMQRSQFSLADALAHKCIHDQLRPQFEHYSQSYKNMAAIRKRSSEVLIFAHASVSHTVVCIDSLASCSAYTVVA